MFCNDIHYFTNYRQCITELLPHSGLHLDNASHRKVHILWMKNTQFYQKHEKKERRSTHKQQKHVVNTGSKNENVSIL